MRPALDGAGEIDKIKTKEDAFKEGLAEVAKLRKSAEKKRGKAAGQFVTHFLESFDA